MFKNIQRNYKKNLRENKFNKYYWFIAILLMIISLIFKMPNNIKPYFIYISLFILVIGYFIFDYFKVTKNVNLKIKQNFQINLKITFMKLNKKILII